MTIYSSVCVVTVVSVSISGGRVVSAVGGVAIVTVMVYDCCLILEARKDNWSESLTTDMTNCDKESVSWNYAVAASYNCAASATGEAWMLESREWVSGTACLPDDACCAADES